MNIYLLALISLVLSYHHAVGQELQKETIECDCKLAFQDMIHKLEHNYIGLKQLQNANKDEEYRTRKGEFEQKSAEILPENCTEFLNNFLDYFGDGHLFVFERPKHSESEVSDYKKRIKATKLDKDRLIDLGLSIHDQGRNVIEGMWTDGKSEFIIVEAGNGYKAYVSESTRDGVDAGELKAVFRPQEKGYSCTYYSYAYSPSYVRGDVYKDGELLVMGHVFWKKVDASFSLGSGGLNTLSHPRLTVLNENSTLLTIPTFNIDYQVFKKFIEEHENLIKNSSNLIVDIRGNRGGNGIYFSLIEMYATQPMKGSQGLVLASNDNLAYFERQMSYSKKIYGPVVQRISDNMGRIVDGPAYPGKKFKRKKTNIENVAILTDKACASAAESFILHSKRSSTKVKTFGSATDGMIDYTSVNALLLNSGNQNIYFGYPTSTLHKDIPNNGYNETGIIPDIAIRSEEADKIQYILNYFEE